MVIQLLLSLFFPPLAVILTAGISAALLINIGLTLMGWVPGIIHALWVITKATEPDLETPKSYHTMMIGCHNKNTILTKGNSIDPTGMTLPNMNLFAGGDIPKS